MRKILASASPIVIHIKLNKRLIHAVLGFLRRILDFYLFVIASIIETVGQVISAVIDLSGKILKNLRFVIASLVKITKKVLHSISAFLRFVIVSVVGIIKQLVRAILNSIRFVITGFVGIIKLFWHAILTSLRAISNAFIFVIASLIKITKRVIKTILAFPGRVINALVKIIRQLLRAISSFLRFTITSLAKLIKQFISAVLNSCSFVLNSLFRIKKQFIHGVAFFSITVISSFNFIIDSLIKINKQVISGVVNGIVSSFGTIVSFLGAFLYSLGAAVNSLSTSTIILGAVIAAALASLVKINKKLVYRVIHGFLTFFGFVISSLVRLIKQVGRVIRAFWHAILISLRVISNAFGFVIVSLTKITKQVTHPILSFLRFAIASLVKTIKQITHVIVASFRLVIISLIKITKRLLRAILTSLRRILACCSLVLASFAVIAAFITATTYTQLAIAILLYPALVFFAFKIFPHKPWKYPSRKRAAVIQPQVKSSEVAQEVRQENIGISDIDKRVFLKLLGGTGLFLFLYSIFNKKAEGLFFKSLPGDGNKANPSQNPTDGYSISEIEDSVISFYGYTKKGDGWFVMRVDTNTGSFRYARGDSDFPGNWANRENLKYDYFNNVF